MSEEKKASITGAIQKVGDAAEKITDFLNKVVAGPVNQVSGIAEDWLKFQRYKNLLSLRDKVDKIHEERRLAGKTIPVPPKFVLPILEAASLEENETLQDLWARLLANATDPAYAETIHPAYAEVIRQISSDEAVVLSYLSRFKKYPILFETQIERVAVRQLPNDIRSPTAEDAFHKGIYDQFEQFCCAIELKYPEKFAAYLDNLQRLRLLEISFNFEQKMFQSSLADYLEGRANYAADSNGPEKIFYMVNEYLRMAPFGQAFVVVCINKK